jgi:hypothetical protein
MVFKLNVIKKHFGNIIYEIKLYEIKLYEIKLYEIKLYELLIQQKKFHLLKSLKLY